MSGDKKPCVVEALKVEEVGEMKSQRPGLLDDVLDVMYERKSGSGDHFWVLD